MTTTLIKKLFHGVDNRDWESIISIFDENVLLDYSSMTGTPPSFMKPQEIIAAWSSFLPGFDKTNHQMSGFNISKEDNFTIATFEGKAEHFIGNSVWIVEGNYFIKISNNNKVSLMKFNFRKQSGDIELPKKATEIIHNRIH